MIYGCIGETLKHSFSKEIHNLLNEHPYELCEVAKTDLDAFMIRRDFKAINVTIPYKEAVIPHLCYIDPHAKEIGAVNTVINKNGKLFGYNTDFYGMTKLIERVGVKLEDKKVVILGTGGTSKTSYAVAKALGATEIVKVSRRNSECACDYSELYSHHTDAQVIINTTPVGMYPNADASPCDLRRFTKLKAVIDAVYNPLRTRLVLEARKLGIPAECGLYMLVAQGVRASEIFLDTSYPEGDINRIYNKIASQKENIVLTGMPSSGKSTVGKLLARLAKKEFVDTDALIEDREGMTIPDIFKEKGEVYFRMCEKEVIKSIASQNGKVIATGGGAILDATNIDALKSNGKIFFIDRSLTSLIPTDDRPLSSNIDDLKKRYEERYPLYCERCDVRIDANATPEEVAEKIYGVFTK